MLEIEQWIIQNNQSFFIEELKKEEESESTLEQNIENIKKAELDLLAILEANQTESELSE